MSETELQAMLQKINEAMEEAKANPDKEIKYLDALVDPADANACDGCQ